jgi:Subtilase family
MNHTSKVALFTLATVLATACAPDDPTPQDPAAPPGSGSTSVARSASDGPSSGPDGAPGAKLPDVKVSVDPTLKPTRTSNKGTIGTLRDGRGIQTDFIENQLIALARNRASAEAVAKRIGADSVTKEGTQSDDEFGMYRIVMNKIVDYSDLPVLIRTKSKTPIGGAISFSSGLAASNFAISLRETREGEIALMQDYLLKSQGEAPSASTAKIWNTTYQPQAESWPYLRNGGPLDIGFVGAWNRLEASTQRNEMIWVSIIDGGFRRSPDLPAHTLIQPADAWGRQNPDNCNNPAGCPWHGYTVSSVVGATKNNNTGIAGAAGGFAKLHLVAAPNFDFVEIAEFIGGVVSAGSSRVVNVSASMKIAAVPSIAVEAAWFLVREAMGSRMPLVVAAAGNNGDDVDAMDSFGPISWEEGVTAPCEFEGVLCVGGTDTWESRALPHRNSAWGHKDETTSVDMFAPFYVWGMSAGPDANTDTVTPISGTSYSAPLVASAAALVFAANPRLTAAQVSDILLQTAHKEVAPVRRFLNADEAVRVALGKQAPLILSRGVDQGTVGKPFTIRLASGVPPLQLSDEAVVMVSNPDSRDGSIKGLDLNATVPAQWNMRRSDGSITFTPTTEGDFIIPIAVSNGKTVQETLRVLVKAPEVDILMHAGSGEGWVGAQYYATARAIEWVWVSPQRVESVVPKSFANYGKLVPCSQVRFEVRGDNGELPNVDTSTDQLGNCNASFRPTSAQKYEINATVRDALGNTVIKRTRRNTITVSAPKDTEAAARAELGGLNNESASTLLINCGYVEDAILAGTYQTKESLTGVATENLSTWVEGVSGGDRLRPSREAAWTGQPAAGVLPGFLQAEYSREVLTPFLTVERTLLGANVWWFGQHSVAVTEMQTYGMKLVRPTILPIGYSCNPN